jgi:hypothetical protein
MPAAEKIVERIDDESAGSFLEALEKAREAISPSERSGPR